jgi:hypothetical protein
LTGTIVVELGLLLYATLRARQGKSAAMPPVETVIDALPALATAAVGAARVERAMKQKRRRRHG